MTASKVNILRFIVNNTKRPNYSPAFAYKYAKDIVKGRWSAGERFIVKDLYYSQVYARDVIKGRWPEGERAILEDPIRYLRKGSWRDQDHRAWHAFDYANEIIMGRWPEAESYLLSLLMEAMGNRETKLPQYVIFYAGDVIKGRWKEAEQIVLDALPSACAVVRDRLHDFVYEYAKDVIKGRWLEAEQHIMRDQDLAEMYAEYFGLEYRPRSCFSG